MGGFRAALSCTCRHVRVGPVVLSLDIGHCWFESRENPRLSSKKWLHYHILQKKRKSQHPAGSCSYTLEAIRYPPSCRDTTTKRDTNLHNWSGSYVDSLPPFARVALHRRKRYCLQPHSRVAYSQASAGPRWLRAALPDSWLLVDHPRKQCARCRRAQCV